MRRRVLHVSDNALGGVAAFIGAIGASQLEAGVDVTVAMPDGPVPEALRIAGARHLPWSAGPRPDHRLRSEVRSLGRVVTDVRPDLVHLHNDKAGMVGRLLLRRRLPTVFQPHAWSFVAVPGPVGRATLVWERLAARWTDAVVCVSHGEAEQARAAGVGAELVVAPNGVDLDRWPPAEDAERTAARAELGLGDAPLAVSVGRLHRQKNQGALLDAWPRVRELVPEARLALVGDGPDRPELEARAVDGVTLVGETRAVHSWLCAADVIAQPSRWEGLSLALLEALATRRSVVVTDVPGMTEVVRPGIGAVVAPGDITGLAGAIAARLADPQLAAAEGAAGRAAVERDHDLRGQAATIAALYDRLLGGGSGKSGALR